MEGRKETPSPEHHLHILHIHFHFYRSAFHLGHLYRHMRKNIYLRRFGYRDPHRMRIYAFYKGTGVRKGMWLNLDKLKKIEYRVRLALQQVRSGCFLKIHRQQQYLLYVGNRDVSQNARNCMG